jgi:asparagine synthase (glutamine-hydrolysing)
MCGIAGVVGPGAGNRGLLDRMTGALVHRGPDGSGSLIADNVALGMRRLAIIDVAGGDQPIYNEDRTVAIVFNGEIYNFQDLRRDLEGRGHRFSTNSDTECIVHAYEEYGRKCVERLRGMFAFALWDFREQRLLLARDRVGKKPMYYRVDGARLWFASELKALIQDESFTREVDPIAVHHFLTYLYVPAPLAIYRGVEKLPPAHTLVFENGKVSVERYWTLEYLPKGVVSERDAVDQLDEILRESTAARMTSERPVGAFLSGGIDSSLVVANMAGLQSEPVKTFSIGFEHEDYDERKYARMVAERFGTDHHEFVVAPGAVEWLPTLTWQYDEPFADSSAIASMQVARMASQEVTVVLNGDGGDESFAGYERYAASMLLDRVPLPRLIPRLARGSLRMLRMNTPPGVRRKLVRRGLDLMTHDPATRYFAALVAFNNERKLALYTPEMRTNTEGVDSAEIVLPTLHDRAVPNLLDAMLRTDVEHYLPGDLLVKMDIATMAHSLEARSPFLDHRLMEFAARLPNDLKLRRSESSYTSKYILKQVARCVLPDELIDRRKMGFAVPLAHWLRSELRDLSYDALTDQRARDRGWFEPAAITQLLDEHNDGLDHTPRIWGLLQLELWCRAYLDAGASTAAAVAQSIRAVGQTP